MEIIKVGVKYGEAKQVTRKGVWFRQNVGFTYGKYGKPWKETERPQEEIFYKDKAQTMQMIDNMKEQGGLEQL